MQDTHHIIKHRRNGSTLYRCNHHTHYMKVGGAQEIEHEVDLYQKLKTAWIPLPELLWFEINEDDLSWMKEELLTWELYADIFTREFEATWFISEEAFNNFVKYQLEHLDVQCKIAWDQTITNIGFDSYQYLFSEWLLEHDLAEKLIEKINQDVSIVKNAWNHGDHNQYNIFNNGVIDLEDSFYGPIGYDTITSLTQNFWFPDPRNNEIGELTRQHSFTKEQVQAYMTSIQKNEVWINFMDSNVFGALFLMRGVFVTVKSDWFPLLRKFRYQKLNQAIQAYLAWENMVDYFVNWY